MEGMLENVRRVAQPEGIKKKGLRSKEWQMCISEDNNETYLNLSKVGKIKKVHWTKLLDLIYRTENWENTKRREGL